jgi:hypothetical protein
VAYFFAGMAAGAIVALIVLALAQASGRGALLWQAEDAVRERAQQTRADIEKERQEAHDIAHTVTPQELELVLTGRYTFADIVRGRKDPSSPFFRPDAGGDSAPSPAQQDAPKGPSV